MQPLPAMPQRSEHPTPLSPTTLARRRLPFLDPESLIVSGVTRVPSARSKNGDSEGGHDSSQIVEVDLDHDDGERRPAVGSSSMDEGVAARILDTLRAKDACIAELERSLHVTVLANRSLAAENDDLKMTNSGLLQQLTDLIREVGDRDALILQRDAAEQQAQRYASALDDANKALDMQLRGMTDVADKLSASERQNHQLRDDKAALEQKVAALKANNSKLLTELEHVAKDADGAVSRCQILEAEIKTLREHLDHKASEQQLLSAQHASSTAQLRLLVQRIDEQEAEHQRLRSQVETLRDEKLLWMDKHRDAATAAATHASTAETIDEMRNRTEVFAESAARECDLALEQVRHWEATSADIAAKLAAASRERDEAMEDAARSQERVREWQARCDEARQEAERLCCELRNSESTYEASLNFFRSELDRCQSQIDTQASIVQAHKALEDTVSIEKDALSTTVEDLKDLLHERNQELEGLRHTNQRLMKELALQKQGIQRDHVIHAAELRDLHQLSLDASQKHSEQLEELVRAQEHVVKQALQHEEACVRLRERVAHLEAALLEKTQEKSAMEVHIRQLHDRVESLVVTASAKERSDAAVVKLNDQVAQFSERTAYLEQQLMQHEYRTKNLQDKVKFHEKRVAEAASLEAELEAVRIQLGERNQKVSELEVAVASRKESVRRSLEERKELRRKLEETQREVEEVTNKHQALLKKAEDRHRAALQQCRQAAVDAAQQHQSSLDRLKLQHDTLASLYARHVAHHISIGIIYAAQQIQGESARSRSQWAANVDHLVGRLLTHHEQSLDRMAHQLTDTRRRWKASQTDARRAQETVDALLVERDALIRRASEDAAAHQRQHLMARQQQQSLDAAQRQTEAMMMNLSAEVRASCNDISREVLGLDGVHVLMSQLHATSITTTETPGAGAATLRGSATEAAIPSPSRGASSRNPPPGVGCGTPEEADVDAIEDTHNTAYGGGPVPSYPPPADSELDDILRALRQLSSPSPSTHSSQSPPPTASHQDGTSWFASTHEHRAPSLSHSSRVNSHTVEQLVETALMRILLHLWKRVSEANDNPSSFIAATTTSVDVNRGKLYLQSASAYINTDMSRDSVAAGGDIGVVSSGSGSEGKGIDPPPPPHPAAAIVVHVGDVIAAWLMTHHTPRQ